jgi:hypothetical protein
MYGKIVLAYDGSQEGQKALINCKEMATCPGVGNTGMP